MRTFILCICLGLTSCAIQTGTVSKPLQKSAALKPHNLQPKSAAPAPIVQEKVILVQKKHPEVSEIRFDIAANDAPAPAFFMGLVEGTDTNMVVHPEVTGNISIKLKQVTIEETLKAVRDVYGFDYLKKPYGYQIVPRKLQSKIFRINYLNVNRHGISSTQVSSGQVSQASSSTESSTTSTTESSTETIQSTKIQTESTSDFWAKLHHLLTLIVGKDGGRSVVVEPDAGIAVVKAYPQEIQAVGDFLARAELSLKKQVIIEAKILEVGLDEGYQSGIQWDTFGLGYNGQLTNTQNAAVGSLSPGNFETLVDNTIEGFFSVGLNYTDFTAVIQLLSSQGDVQVLSSPRIATVNNQKAVIKVGSDEYFVTEISNNTTATSTTTSDSPEVTLTPFFSGIALDVTPHVSEDNEVILHVHPTITEVSEKIKNIGVGDNVLSLPLAFSTIRETDSIIKAKNEEIVVIGGLMQKKVKNLEAGIPYLKDLPGIGKFFTQQRDVTNKSELVILLKPKVVESSDWESEYEVIEEKYRNLLNKTPSKQEN